MTIAIFASDSPRLRYTYRVNWKVIGAESAYFRRLPASVRRFRHLDLVDENPEAFALVLGCLDARPAAGRSVWTAVEHHSQKRDGETLSSTAVSVLAYILAGKWGMDRVCNQIMDRVLHCHDVRDMCTGALDGKTISSFPECKVAGFLVDQLAWVLAEKRMLPFCKCTEDAVEGRGICSQCVFMGDQSGASLKLRAKLTEHAQVRFSDGWDKRAEPRRMGYCYWHVRGDKGEQELSCPEVRVCDVCLKEQGELEMELTAEKDGKLAVGMQVRKGDPGAQYLQVLKWTRFADTLEGRECELRLGALSLDESKDELGDADDAAFFGDDVLSASDFGDFDGRSHSD